MMANRCCRALRPAFLAAITLVAAVATGGPIAAAQSAFQSGSGPVEKADRPRGRADASPRRNFTDRDSPLRPTLETADSLYREGALEEALGRLQTAHRARPENPEVLYRLAFAWADLGKQAREKPRENRLYRKAIGRAEAALAADSTSAWAHLALAVAQGRFLKHLGPRERVERSRAVKRHAQQAIALDPTLADAYYVRGLWHRAVADLGMFRRAAVRVVYGGLPEASIEQALKDFRKALRLKKRTYYHLELGKTYLKMDRVEVARKHLRAVLETAPMSPFAPNHKEKGRQLLDRMG